MLEKGCGEYQPEKSYARKQADMLRVLEVAQSLVHGMKAGVCVNMVKY